MQRLEKERREMEKTIEGFRRSQAKLVELEKTNKKLQVHVHVHSFLSLVSVHIKLN